MHRIFNLTNLIICICLLIILWLVYLKTNKLELFGDVTPSIPNATTTNPTARTSTATPTIPLLSDGIIKNSAIVNFINRFINNKNQQNAYSAILANRQVSINTYANRVLNLINPTM